MGRFDLIKSSGAKPLLTPPAEITLPIAEIADRPHQDTRPLAPDHVEALAENIAAIGLIQPIVVDNKNHLLAGAHRRAAIALLKKSDPDSYQRHFPNGVPVHRFDFDASKDGNLALAIEASENERRRDYSPKEVRELADRLIAAGYHHTRGVPKKGTKPLIPALEAIVGKSRSQVKRYLRDDQDEPLNRSDDQFGDEDLNEPFRKDLDGAIKALQKLEKNAAVDEALSKGIHQLLKKLEVLKP